MTDRQFRRLSRGALIEIIYELQNAQAQLQEENEALQKALAARQLKIERAGSIAEAALALQDVFEAAQAAADTYLAQTREANEKTQQLCDRLIADAQRKADAIVRAAQVQADAIDGRQDEKIQCETDAMYPQGALQEASLVR